MTGPSVYPATGSSIQDNMSESNDLKVSPDLNPAGIHVCMIGPKTCPPDIGGIEVFVSELGKRLSAKGIRVSILSSRLRGQKRQEVVDGVQVYRVRAIRNRYLLKISMIPGEIRLLRRLRPTIVHAHDPVGATICTFMFNSRATVVTFHGVGSSKSEWPTPFRQFARILQRLSVGKAGTVTTTDVATATQLRRWRKDILVIHGGVDTSTFRRRSYPVPDVMRNEKTNMIFVGRLTRVKGLDVLLDSLELLPDRLQERLALTVVGSGPLAHLLTSHRGSSVRINWVGEITHEKIAPYFSNADLMIMPSRSEGLPISLLEAMASELPVICTMVGGVGANFNDNHVTVIDEISPQSVARAIETALANEEKLREKSTRAKELVERYYSWESVTTEFLRLYRQAAK